MNESETAGSVLKALLDDTGFYSRFEWGYFFRTTEADIESWVKDERLPTQMRLSLLLDLLRHRGGELAKPALNRWDIIASKPMSEVVPLLRGQVFDYPVFRTLGEFVDNDSFPPKKEYRSFLELVCKKDIYTGRDL
ncbi:MAG TPA: hypothetical protein VEB18_03175 [Candidatus Paceibacterota bacterium]|nr:hypothetical protein [Candidatus Paceibacterota bacterium]